jgi:hypothetical protein
VHQGHILAEFTSLVRATAAHDFIVEFKRGLHLVLIIRHGEALVVIHRGVEFVLIGETTTRGIATKSAVSALGEAADFDIFGLLFLTLALGLIFCGILHHLGGTLLSLLLSCLATHTKGKMGLAKNSGGVVGPKLKKLRGKASVIGNVRPREQLLVGERF